MPIRVVFSLSVSMIVIFTGRMVVERVRAAESLEQANGELELRVAKRTADLERVNAALRGEIKRRRQWEGTRRQLERSLIQAERMATVGTVAAGIVHNLKNSLMGILGHAELLEVRHPGIAGPDEIRRSANQMNEMIEDILTKCRTKRKREAIDLNQLLRHELDFQEADPVFKYEVEKVLEFDDGLGPVNAVYTDLSQVFGNLLRNAVDAMHASESKRLTVATRSTEDGVEVAISDTGCGIPDSVLPQVFDPFFTTKDGDGNGRGPAGTGIGLYTVYRIAEQYEAEVRIESEVGVGTTMVIRLPSMPIRTQEGPETRLSATRALEAV